MAATSDLFKKVGASTVTTLAAPGKALSATSITVGSTTNYDTDTGIVIAIRVVDSSGELVAGTYTEWSATVTSGTTLAIEAVPVYGSDQVYAAGSTTQVCVPLSAYSHDKLVDGILVEHAQDGTHTDITADSIVVLGDVEAASFTLTGAGGDNGWSSGLPAPNTVTNNGNRSYDLVFNSNDLTDTLSEGMRLRTTRTVTAPTQCADLEASSSQYFSATSASLAGMTFTDDFVVSAWVKLESYATMTIASRRDANSGWRVQITSSGIVQSLGFNSGTGNQSYVQSYQSIPLNKWVHIAIQLDMSTFTATSTTSYVMIDGVDVPANVGRAGTNPIALIQAGNLEIGSVVGSAFFDGKLAQVAIFGAKVTQATMRGYISQGLAGTETNLVSAYSCNNSLLDLNTTNNNDLTANGGALMTNVDSPFGNYLGGTLDYGIITKTAFSTNTTLTVQVPEGCTIPTTGGVSAVAYSTQSVPYGFVPVGTRWSISALDSNFTTVNPLVVLMLAASIDTPMDNIRYANTGTSGGTMYISQNGLIRRTFGATASQSTTTSSSFTWIFPTGLYGTLHTLNATGGVVGGIIPQLVTFAGKAVGTNTLYMVTTGGAGTLISEVSALGIA